MLSMRVGPSQSVIATEVSAPEPAPDEAVVAVEASSVNRGELALISMRPEGWAPGQDVAGVVIHAAADGTGPAEGARVAGLAEQGAWSEQVAVRASRLAELPSNVSFDAAAALPMAGLTALRTVRLLGSVIGRRVLITGASGGVGRLQTQLANRSGAEVQALSRSGEVPSAARTLPDISTAGPVDAALESLGGDILTEVISTLRPDSTLVWFGNSLGQTTALSIYDFIGHEGARLVTYFSYTADATEDSRDLNTLLALVSDGQLDPGIAAAHPLTQAGDAVQQLHEGGVGGKIILTLDSPANLR